MAKSMNPRFVEQYRKKLTTPEQAIREIRPGQRIFIGSNCAEPLALVEALTLRGDTLEDNEILHILRLGVTPSTEEKFVDRFRSNVFFIGANLRKAVARGTADYTPVFLSEIPALLRSGQLPIDTALIQVSPPDEHGYCSYGVSVDIVKAAAESARFVVAEVNPQMPRTLGNSFIHINEIDRFVESNHPILSVVQEKADEIAMNIGKNIADLIEDGSTIQMGIGTIPDAILHFLDGKEDLGVHTEMFSDGLLKVIENGIVTCRKKTLHPYKVIASFAMGSPELYASIDNNPFFEFHPTEYTNDPFIIAQNDKMVAINSAIEVDLTGQVCADSIGTYFYSGIGGQVDFIRGSARSRGGKPVIALPSTAKNGAKSRIVASLSPGAGVVTTRGDVHYVVTEFGIAYLHGKSIRERALSLINIAHPQFREELLDQAKELHFIYQDQPEAPLVTRYPNEFITKDILEDGIVVTVRPVRGTDEPLMKAFFYKLSKETVYRRFHAQMKAMPHRAMKDMIDVDYKDRMALSATVGELGKEEIVGVGRFYRNPSNNFAEVAFTVRDDWQDRGVGSILFARLIETARQMRITGFDAYVQWDNHRMLHIFMESGYEISSRLEGDQYLLKMSFEKKRQVPPESNKHGAE